MKRRILGIFLIGVAVLGLAACSGEDDQPEAEEETTADAEKDEVALEPVSVERFAEIFINGEFDRIYQQFSEEFQAQVSLEEFASSAAPFNQDIEYYELVSEIPLFGMMEYQWVSDDGDKGIRSYWDENSIIHGLMAFPISSYPDRDAVYTKNTYRMPINEEWFVFWGGTNELVNYHYSLEVQRYAYDLLIRDGESSFNGDETDNENYYAFGKDVVAPLDGVVVAVENNIADNTPTVDTNMEEPLGNYVIIEHDHDEYSVLAHFQEGSIVVDVGDEVEAGQLLGSVGNSGTSSEAHIHFHVADRAEWEEATSIRIKFEGDLDPVRGDVVDGF